MKVLYIIDSLKAYGAEKSLALLAIGFKNIKPVFMSLTGPSELQPLLESNGIKVYSGVLENDNLDKNSFHKIVGIVEKEKPTIIHATLFRSDAVSRKLKTKFPGICLVGSLVSNSYSKNRYDTLSPFFRLKLFTTQLRDRASVGKVDYFISNSQAIVRSNIKALGIPKDKIRVIHRGRAILDMNLAQPELVERYRGKKVFISVGRLCKSKGQIDLVRAFQKLDVKELNLVLLIIGDGPDYYKLKEEIRLSRMEDHIHLMGYRTDVRSIFEISDYFIFPSYFEGLPGALLEAILAKIPCIVSDIPENRECFPLGGGIFFRTGDIDGIAWKIEETLKMENLDEKVEANYNFAVKTFSLELAVKNYEEFYFKILESW